MQTEIIIAGFGGQGVLFAGQLLAYAAMDEGREVTWIPSYGPEMRGGTANCTVIIADEEIGSPLVRNPQAVIAMNLPSLDKYEPTIGPNGVMVINASMINRSPTRTDIRDGHDPRKRNCRIARRPAHDEYGFARRAAGQPAGSLFGSNRTSITGPFTSPAPAVAANEHPGASPRRRVRGSPGIIQ